MIVEYYMCNMLKIVLVDETYILNYNYDSVDTVEVMKEFEVLKDISISTLTES